VRYSAVDPSRFTEADPFAGQLDDRDALTIQTAANMPTERLAFQLIDQRYGTGTLARHAAASRAMCRVRDGHPTLVGGQVVMPAGASVTLDATEATPAPARPVTPALVALARAAHAQLTTQTQPAPPVATDQTRAAAAAFWSLPARSIESLINQGFDAPLPDGTIYARDRDQPPGWVGVRDLHLHLQRR